MDRKRKNKKLSHYGLVYCLLTIRIKRNNIRDFLKKNYFCLRLLMLLVYLALLMTITKCKNLTRKNHLLYVRNWHKSKESKSKEQNKKSTNVCEIKLRNVPLKSKTFLFGTQKKRTKTTTKSK